MTKICRIAGLFLLIAAISMIAQGIQPGSTGNVSSVDGWNPAFSMATQTGDNISNLQVVQVTNQTGEQVSPRISGNWIVWIGFENESDGGGLYLYDIAHRSEKRILDCSPFWTFPEISDNWIGWVENQTTPSVYMTFLTTQPFRLPASMPCYCGWVVHQSMQYLIICRR